VALKENIISDMLRRDIFMAEIQKLAQVLARVLDLKSDGQQHEAEELVKNTLTEDFGLNFSELNTMSVQDFESILNAGDYGSQKLDILGQFLFESVYPFEDIPETDNMLHKVLLIFRLLEEEHHIQSFENLNKREMIDKYLNNRQVE
jgi:hypothetical protein